MTWPSRFIDNTEAGRLFVNFASEPAGWVFEFDRIRTDLYIGGTDFELKTQSFDLFKYLTRTKKGARGKLVFNCFYVSVHE